MKRIVRIIAAGLVVTLSCYTANAQRYLPVNTAAGYLTVAPDARSAALGNIGAASSPDASSQYWNSSKYVFMPKDIGVSLSYVPWMRNIVNDINLINLAGYYKLDANQSLSASLNVMSYGSAYVRNDNSELELSSGVSDFSIDVAYARKLGEGFSAGVAFRYIRAVSGSYQQKVEYGNAFAVDINAYYALPLNLLSANDELAFGLNLSNIGTKIKGSHSDDKYFLPSNLRLGGRLTTVVENDHKFSLMADINKLMVPAPSVDDNGVVDAHLDKSSLAAVFYSFGDSSFSNELKEMTWASGLEYTYLSAFSARLGYFHESTHNGARSYIGFGAGYRYRMATLDLSYSMHTRSANPALGDTFRVTLGVLF